MQRHPEGGIGGEPHPTRRELGPPRTLIYEIFVDRFAGNGGTALPAVPEGVDPWRHHLGGTLDGIVERLDHIASVGADALYLTPIFRAPSNHKYDTASFDEVEPRFGGLPAFHRLAAACRERGLGLILDGVFNHIGEEHAWFDRARKDRSCAEASYFRWTEHPNDYARWRGMGWLPELDLEQTELLSLLFDGENSILRRWLREGATGWRLDCANDLGSSVCARARVAARLEGSLDGVIGEVTAYADNFIAHGALDGVMNYYFRESILGLARGEVPVAQAAYNLKRMARAYPASALLRSWNVLATHDTERMRNLVPDAAARAFAYTLAFVSPGVPLIYYGEEVGLEGGPDPDNRRPMPWDPERWDRATLEHIRRLAALRREHRALREGKYVPLPQPGAPALLAFARSTSRPHDIMLVMANGSPEKIKARVFLPHPFLFDGLPVVDLLGRAPSSRIQSGRIDIELEPFQVAIHCPDDSTISGYRFFKDRRTSSPGLV